MLISSLFLPLDLDQQRRKTVYHLIILLIQLMAMIYNSRSHGADQLIAINCKILLQRRNN